MGQFEIHGFDEMLAELDRIGRFGDVAPKMLKEAAPILQEEVVRQAEPHKDTGEMAASIKPTGVMAGKSGSYYICVRPTGYASKKWKYARKKDGGKDGSKRPVRNMEKLVWLEFGTKKQAATPILKTATANAAPKVRRKLQEIFNREIGKG